jgi:hypothetical protein
VKKRKREGLERKGITGTGRGSGKLKKKKGKG